MAYYFPEGSKFYLSTTFAGAKTITAVTNANPAVATSTSHGYVDNDVVLFTSGWEDATDSVFKVDQQTADTFQLLGLNSSSTTNFSVMDALLPVIRPGPGAPSLMPAPFPSNCNLTMAARVAEPGGLGPLP